MPEVYYDCVGGQNRFSDKLLGAGKTVGSTRPSLGISVRRLSRVWPFGIMRWRRFSWLCFHRECYCTPSCSSGFFICRPLSGDAHHAPPRNLFYLQLDDRLGNRAQSKPRDLTCPSCSGVSISRSDRRRGAPVPAWRFLGHVSQAEDTLFASVLACGTWAQGA